MKKSTLIKSIIIIGTLILGLNTIQLFNFFIVKKGSLNFFDLTDHIYGYVNTTLALIATYISWQILSRIQIKPALKVVLSFLLAFLNFAFLSSIYFSIVRWYHQVFIDANQLIGNIVFSFSLSFLPVAGISLAYLYFRDAQKEGDVRQKLELEKQNLQSQLLSKNLEPHFLFNNLSILSSLMHKNSDQAEVFLDNLSEVYRYFLKHNESEKVALNQEIEFLENYTFLMVNRFGGAYQILIQVQDKSGMVLPFVIHTCVENAIKHNAASEEDPLIILISRQGDQVSIKNPVRPAAISPDSIGQGLRNISLRYELIFGKSIAISEENGMFEVKIPVIK